MTNTDSKFRAALRVFFERYFLPLLLGAVVMNLIFRTYMRFYYNTATVIFAAYECLLFFIFEKIKPLRFLRAIIYLVLGFAHLYLSGQLFAQGWYSSGVSVTDWFYVNATEIGEVYPYIVLLYTALGFFMVSVLYYFTVYRFRSFGIMMVIVFPFVIYGKRDDTLSTLSITLMVTLFLALLVHQRLISDDSKKNVIINSSYVIAAALFVTFAGAVTMVIPKPEYQSALESDSGIFSFDVNTNTTLYDDLNDESSPRFGADATGEILFYVRSEDLDDVFYIRRQSFDVFRNEIWRLDPEYEMYFTRFENDENEVNSPEYLHRIMRDLAKTGRYKEYGLDPDKFDVFGEYTSSAWMSLSGSTYSPTYIPAPLLSKIDPMTYMFKTAHGEVYYYGIDKQYMGLDISYNILTESYPEREFAENLGMDQDRFRKMLAAARGNGDLSWEQYKNIMKLLDMYTQTEGVSDRTAALAADIIKDCDTDYEKAFALEQYFEEQGYVYDQDFEPEDKTIDYFIFESKTGICTSYATAMVLMARSQGLPARYVEGFAAYERAPDGRYVIRDSHAHAFVEVYISGVGWMTFDPTVPGYMRDYSNSGSSSGNAARTFVDYFARLVLFIGVVFVLVFIVFIDRIIEFLFRIRLKFRRSYADKTLALYRRTLRLLEISSPTRVRGMTSEELTAFADEREADISPTAQLFDKVCFGEYSPSKEEFKEVFRTYRKNWKAIAGKKRKKKPKKNKPELSAEA